MPEPEQLSLLIGHIYDAALNPSLWVSVLEKSSNFVGGVAAGLHTKDLTSKAGGILYNCGFEPEVERS